MNELIYKIQKRQNILFENENFLIAIYLYSRYNIYYHYNIN